MNRFVCPILGEQILHRWRSVCQQSLTALQYEEKWWSHICHLKGHFCWGWKGKSSTSKEPDWIRDGIMLCYTPEVQRNSSPLKNGGFGRLLYLLSYIWVFRSLLQGSPFAVWTSGGHSETPRTSQRWILLNYIPGISDRTFRRIWDGIFFSTMGEGREF